MEAAAGILAVEAYHAGNICTALAGKGVQPPDLGILGLSSDSSDSRVFDITNKISAARDLLDDPSTDKDRACARRTTSTSFRPTRTASRSAASRAMC